MGGFNRNAVEKIGEHKLAIESVKFQSTRKGTGTVLKVLFRVLNLKSRIRNWKFYQYFNIRNEKLWIQQKGLEELKSLYEACSLNFNTDIPAYLVGKTVVADIELKHSTQYRDLNRATNFKPDSGKGEGTFYEEAPE